MILLYSLDSDAAFAQALAAYLGLPLASHENRGFEDGERKLRPLRDPRGHDAYVVHSLYGDLDKSPYDKLCQLLMFIATLRDGAQGCGCWAGSGICGAWAFHGGCGAGAGR